MGNATRFRCSRADASIAGDGKEGYEVNGRTHVWAFPDVPETNQLAFCSNSKLDDATHYTSHITHHTSHASSSMRSRDTTSAYPRALTLKRGSGAAQRDMGMRSVAAFPRWGHPPTTSQTGSRR